MCTKLAKPSATMLKGNCWSPAPLGSSLSMLRGTALSNGCTSSFTSLHSALTFFKFRRLSSPTEIHVRLCYEIGFDQPAAWQIDREVDYTTHAVPLHHQYCRDFARGFDELCFVHM